MGFSVTWVAVQGHQPVSILAALSLVPTGQTCKYLEHKGITSYQMSSGWYIVFAHGCGHDMASAACLEALSAECTVVACNVEDHVGFWRSELWRGGRSVWSATFTSEDEVEAVEVTGIPPARYAELLRTAESASSSVEGHCHGDIPMILAKDVTGFLHEDIHPEIEEARFQILRSTRPEVPWWRRWLKV